MSLYRTTACKHFDCAMVKEGKCNFAHNESELVLRMCNWDNRCRLDNCNRFHPGRGESIEEYLKKNKIVFAVKKEKKEKFEKKEIKYYINPNVMNIKISCFDDSDDEDDEDEKPMSYSLTQFIKDQENFLLNKMQELNVC